MQLYLPEILNRVAFGSKPSPPSLLASPCELSKTMTPSRTQAPHLSPINPLPIGSLDPDSRRRADSRRRRTLRPRRALSSEGIQVSMHTFLRTARGALGTYHVIYQVLLSRGCLFGTGVPARVCGRWTLALDVYLP